MRYTTDVPRNIAQLLCSVLIILSSVSIVAGYAAERQESTVVLRIRIDNKIVLGEADLRQMRFNSGAEATAAFRSNVVPIKRGQSVQLQVEMVDAHGKTSNVTKIPEVAYHSLSPWKLAVTAGGLVTMAPSESTSSTYIRPSEVGDTAVFISYANGLSTGWNKIFFSTDNKAGKH